MELPPTHTEGFHTEESVRGIRYRQLGKTDMMVSTLSFGASSLGGVFKTTDDSESASLVKRVLQQGVNYIDTAPWYGQGRSERVLGIALKGIPRKAYYLATKVGRYELEPREMFDFTKDRVLRSVEESLQRLGVDYIDVIQVHDVEFSHSLEQVVKHTLPALALLKAQGKVRYVGVTGYNLGTLQRLIEAAPPGSIDTVLSYCRATLFDRSLFGQALDFFQERNIALINASPVSMGLLSTRGPPAWHPATQDIKAVCAKAAVYCTDQGEDITDLAVLWSLAQEDIPTTLTSTASRVNLDKNLSLAKGSLTEKQKKVLEQLWEKYFRFMTNVHWESMEVANYWKQMAEAGCLQKSDLGRE